MKSRKVALTRAPKRPTNVQVIKGLMEEPPTAGLTQTFVMAAILYYSETILRQGPGPCTTATIDGKQWVKCAKTCKERITAHLGSNMT
jgi:hypothetical protein